MREVHPAAPAADVSGVQAYRSHAASEDRGRVPLPQGGL